MLPGIRADWFRLDKDELKWSFRQLLEALRKWTKCKAKVLSFSEKNLKRGNLCQTTRNEQKPCISAYYNKKACWLQNRR